MNAPESEISNRVPLLLRVSAALSWRFVVVIAALYVVAYALSFLASIVIPVAIALLLAALLSPGVAKLVEWRVPRGVATTVMMIIGIGVLGGVLTFVISEFSRGLPELQTQVAASLDTIQTWLKDGLGRTCPTSSCRTTSTRS